MTEHTIVGRRHTDMDGMPPDEVLKYLAAEAIENVKGLRTDVQGLHGVIKDVFNKMENVTEARKQEQEADKETRKDVNDLKIAITKMETRMITFGAIYTGALVLMGVVIALLNLILKKGP